MGLLIALCIVAAAEIVLRLLPPAWLLGYDFGLATYYEVKHHMESFGTPHVCVLGSSRGREGLVIPELRRICEEELGREMTIVNYSCPDDDANTIEIQVETLLERHKRPELILYMLTPRTLLGSAIKQHQLHVLEKDEAWSTPIGHIESFLEHQYYTFRHRFRVHRLLAGLAQGRVLPSPVKGELTEWQKYKPNRRLIGTRVTDDTVREYVGRLLDDQGRYVLGTNRVEALHNLVVRCHDEGVPIALVEIPVSDILRKHLPPDVYPRFHQILEATSIQDHVPYYPLGNLPVAFSEQDFREESHLNYHGALKLTRAVGHHVAVPLLRDPSLPLAPDAKTAVEITP